jgi:FkbM family methyltransferase
VNFFNLEIVDFKTYHQNQILQRNINEELCNLSSAVNKLEYVITKSKLSVDKKFNEINFLNFSCSSHLLVKSKSQIFQDLFVLYILNGKRGGFFVEFGATNGVSLSNTFLLEKEYGWDGILCEPGKVWKNALFSNRNCTIDNRCVWSKSGEKLTFNESKLPELSTLEKYNDADFHSSLRKDGNLYTVETVSLVDLFDYHNAPRVIDYLSIDTEGSEFEILNAFDFSKVDIKIITVEHNFSLMRDSIYDLLTKNGFKRVFETISLFDDWYVKEECLKNN